MSSKILTVVITGATGGIGRALAIEYSRVGYVLILLGKNKLALEALQNECIALGAEATYYSVDLVSTQESLELAAYIASQYDVDLIISNAGVTNNVSDDRRIENWNDIEALLAVNLTGAIAITHPILEKMQVNKKGHVAYVSSIAAYYGMPLTPSYCASKAGLKAYSEAMRGLLVKDSVCVSLITPGFVKTSMSDQFLGAKPFMIDAQSAAKKIKKGLDKKKKVIEFPFFLSLGMRLLSVMPASLADRILLMLKY